MEAPKEETVDLKEETKTQPQEDAPEVVKSAVEIHKSPSTSAVPSDCVVGAVDLTCGPAGSELDTAE